MARHLIAPGTRPVIAVDWSGIGNDAKWWVLRAAVAFEGRSLTLYEEVHPKHHYDRLSVRNKFLKTLAIIIGPEVIPIIVTDAGFRATWFQQVNKMGWHWVGRIRNRIQVQVGQQPWQACKHLHSQATAYAKILHDIRIVRSNSVECNLVLYKEKSRGRCKKRRRDGEESQWWHSKYYKKYNGEPWLLVTSLRSESAARIVNLYRTRMSIEEGFRDLKSGRFGWGFEYARSNQRHRLENLLLIAAMASAAAWLSGWVAKQCGLTRTLQANSVRHKNVLSHHFVGALLLKKTQSMLPIRLCQKAIKTFPSLAYSMEAT